MGILLMGVGIATVVMFIIMIVIRFFVFIRSFNKRSGGKGCTTSTLKDRQGCFWLM